MQLKFWLPPQELLPNVQKFFFEQIHDLEWHAYSNEDIEWNKERHTLDKLQEKIVNAYQYLEIIQDFDNNGKIIGYFESSSVWEDNEKQFIQWIFIHKDYRGQWITHQLFTRFHTFCLDHNYRYIGSCTETSNLVSQKMHEALWYNIEKITDNTIYYIKELIL